MKTVLLSDNELKNNIFRVLLSSVALGTTLSSLVPCLTAVNTAGGISASFWINSKWSSRNCSFRRYFTNYYRVNCIICIIYY